MWRTQEQVLKSPLRTEGVTWAKEETFLSPLQGEDGALRFKFPEDYVRTGDLKYGLRRTRETEDVSNDLERTNEIIHSDNCSDPPYCSLQGKLILYLT